MLRIDEGLNDGSSIAAMEESQDKPKIIPKQITIHEIMEDEKEDRVSALPDCLLSEILSRLPATKDAIKTGSLSKRWQHIWTWVPTLSFEDSDLTQRQRSDFFSLVDKTLTQCRQLKLKGFKVFTRYNGGYESQVKNWIRYAVRRNVEELNLTLFVESKDDKSPLDQYFFISSCFTNLTLCCELNPTGVISWKNLRSLCLSLMKLDDDLIENILSGSPVLETLVLDRCYGYRRLDITAKSAKNLVFCGYYILQAWHKTIEVNAPNILSLTIQGEWLLKKLLLVNVSSLVKANLDYEMFWLDTTFEEEEILKGLILKLRHVKELKIGDFCSQVVSRLEAKGFVFPSNVKLPDVTSTLYS